MSKKLLSATNNSFFSQWEWTIAFHTENLFIFEILKLSVMQFFVLNIFESLLFIIILLMKSIKLFPSKSTVAFKKPSDSPGKSGFDNNVASSFQSQKKLNRYQSWADITNQFMGRNYVSRNTEVSMAQSPEHMQKESLEYAVPHKFNFNKKEPILLKSRNQIVSKRVEALVQQRKQLARQILLINQKLREEQFLTP